MLANHMRAWLCGLHTAGKTYLAREANIFEFTGGRFPAPKGLSMAAEPLAEIIPVEAPVRISPRGSAPEGAVALLVTSEDLSPETLSFGPAKIKAVIIADPIRATGDHARLASFDERALDDTALRVEDRFSATPKRVDLTSRHAAERIADAARGRPVVMAETPTGPTASAIAALSADLDARRVTLSPLRRDWDDAFWPHASRGFFQLREKIPETLRALGLPA